MQNNKRGASAAKASILTYHSIDDSGSVISTPPSKFRQQMEALSQGGHQVMDLEEITSCIRQNRPFPADAVAITFDDGFKNVYEHAYPVLREFGFAATVFLVPGCSGLHNKWNVPSENIPPMDLMDWDQVGEMAQGGVDFGAHTMTHPNLAKVSFDQAVEEIDRSQDEISSKLGKAVNFFAYPYGQQNKRVQEHVRDRFAGACSTELAFVGRNCPTHLLPRIDMYYFAANDLFAHLGTSLLSLYIKGRWALRLLRTWG